MAPLPQAGGVGGGHPAAIERSFNPRDTPRARDLRKQATPAEIKLWQSVSKRQLSGFKFSRQMPIGPYFADFVCRSAKLVVEVDGASHDVRVEYDRNRTELIEAQGYRVIRFSNIDVLQNLDGVLATIVNVLAETSLLSPDPSRLREGKS